jgi:hypothetical protein
MAKKVHRAALQVHRMVKRDGVTKIRRGDLRFFRHCPLSDCMKIAQPELVVGLDGKLTRVLAHWAAVNEALPAEYPLVLLHGWTREVFAELAGNLAGLRDAVVAREVDAGIARGNYKVLKRQVHRALRLFNSWMRGSFKWESWFGLVKRVPGRGQSWGHWSDAAANALTLWRLIVDAPPDPLGRRRTLGDGMTVEQFAELVEAFDETNWEIIGTEVDWGIARGRLLLAQREATALLMAYGHGVRARFGPRSEVVRSIPVLWPKAKPRAVDAA